MEGFASGDESHAARALIDHGRAHGFFQIAFAGRGAAGVDQAGATHVAIHDLVAREIDRMVRREFRINLLVRLAEIQRIVSAVILRQLLLDDVRFDRDAEMIGLTGQVGRSVIVRFLRLERRVAQIAPQDGVHSKLVRLMEHLGDFL